MRIAVELTMPMATSRCRDVCSFAAGDARIAIVGLDPRHDRFGRPGARERRDCFATYAITPHRLARRSHSRQADPNACPSLRRQRDDPDISASRIFGGPHRLAPFPPPHLQRPLSADSRRRPRCQPSATHGSPRPT